MYVETLDDLGIAHSVLRPSSASFHGVIPDHQAYPIGWITLLVTFGDPANFCIERLQFEVVDFPGCYNTILGRSCYAKFMVVPIYTYLKLNMSGPRGIITTTASFKAAYTCEPSSLELLPMLVKSSVGDSLGATDATMVGPKAIRPNKQGRGQKTTLGIVDVPKRVRSGDRRRRCKAQGHPDERAKKNVTPPRQGAEMYVCPKKSMKDEDAH